MNKKDLLRIAVVKRMKLRDNFRWNQKEVPDRETTLIPRKIKETVHPLKNPNHMKISYKLPEIWLRNLR